VPSPNEAELLSSTTLPTQVPSPAFQAQHAADEETIGKVEKEALDRAKARGICVEQINRKAVWKLMSKVSSPFQLKLSPLPRSFSF
jgi:hypothetical protein